MIVSDATSLIILFDLKCEKLLSNIFHKIYIPQTVYKEINARKEIVLLECMEVVKIEKSELLNTLTNILDLGESEAIAFASQKGLALIIDEKKGRKIARNLNLKIVGLLGIVYLNVTKAYLSKEEAVIFLDNAVSNGYRINKNLIKDMLESI